MYDVNEFCILYNNIADWYIVLRSKCVIYVCKCV